MKTRNGFVSNSSSSSFIIAIGKVIDKEKALSFITSCDILEYYWSISKLSDIINQKDLATVNDNEIVVESFEGSSVALNRSSLKEDDEVLVICIANNEGDSGIFDGYIGNGEYGEINYDIILSDLPKRQVRLYDGLNEENGIINVNKTYGAGRNG
jgi:hypothetical protein